MVNNQVASCVVAETLAAMWGRGTEAMDVSSTSMNVGSITAAAIHHGLQSGHHSCIGFAFGSCSGRVPPGGWMLPRKVLFPVETALWAKDLQGMERNKVSRRKI